MAAKRAHWETQLADLNRLMQTNRGATDTLEAVQAALADRSNLLVAKAAACAAELGAKSLIPDLDAAFMRFLAGGIKADQGCRAKTAIAEALYQLDAASEEVFLHGIRYVQLEPSYGGPTDSAVGLRAACASGLVWMKHPDAINEAAYLLADSEDDARLGALRALACAGDPRGEPVLRYKARCGDSNPNVLAECFLALIQVLEDGEGISLVSAELHAKDSERISSAVAALGESRDPRAFPALRDSYRQTVDNEARAGIAYSIASLRCDEAVSFLLDELDEASDKTTESLLLALGVYRHDATVQARVAQAIERRQDQSLSRTFRECFDS